MPNQGYPKIPQKAWRTLRSRAASAPSTRFTAAAVAALLGLSSPKSADNNVLSQMRRVGLFNEDGSLSSRGNKWRVDASYGEACQEILDEVYPSDLSSLTDDSGVPDLQRVRTWFDHRGFGDSNARQMAATYIMIAKKDVTAADAPTEKPAASAGRSRVSSRTTDPHARAAVSTRNRADELPRNESHDSEGRGPNVHLDIQIHIPAEATTEQIDQIFESMARHLYSK